ncbi:uncharacterized protein DUF4829 [Tumebacillus sp. BK434]|uniref:DUF4830 domain-containing protein n=1 Tax=Tumebacillus sp. BK434 TaxID=2512169 RepID=UPI001044B87D|nr:DUF4830 domain-containing protein [Tumebacillus sp. BK434]TCP55625.1 uncharacterized protein DUF4829 [Tumebacillus sp. BK434]
MIQCQEVQEAIWSADLTPEMIEHVLSCSACQKEQNLVQGIGMTLDLEEIPMPSRSLLPPQAEIARAVNAHRWRRFSRYATAGVAAACVLFVAVQVPGYISKPSRDASMQSSGSGAPVNKEMSTEREDGNQSSIFESGGLKKDELKMSNMADALSPKITQLLSKYSWTPSGEAVHQQTVTLPDSFQDAPGVYPQGLYWAKHNLFSKDIGLDLTRYLGETVVAHTILLKEMWDDGLKMNTEAIVLEKDGEVVGAWLEKGGEMAASLQRRDFADLAGVSWDEWLQQEGQVSYTDGPDAEMKDWTPQQVILKYYEAIQNGNYATAYNLYSKAYQSTFWTYETGQTLIAKEWSRGGLSPQNLTFAKVIDVQAVKAPDVWVPAESYKGSRLGRKPVGEQQYQVTLDVKYKTQTEQPDGINALFVGVVKESQNAPWKIEWIDTSAR